MHGKIKLRSLVVVTSSFLNSIIARGVKIIISALKFKSNMHTKTMYSH